MKVGNPVSGNVQEYVALGLWGLIGFALYKWGKSAGEAEALLAVNKLRQAPPQSPPGGA